MGKRGIYLREQGEYVGPFQSLTDAEVFLYLMKWLGASTEGIDILIEDADNIPTEREVTAQEKRRLQNGGEARDEPVPFPPPGAQTDAKRSGPEAPKGDRRSKPSSKGGH